MTTLISRCQKAQAQLEEVETARRNASARALIQQRAKEWDDLVVRLKAARERASWISLVESAVPAIEVRSNQLRHNAVEVLGRLMAGEDVSTLSADALWTRLLQSAVGTAEAFDDAVKAAWRHFVEEQASLAAPAEVQGQLSVTPINQLAISAYRVVHANFARLSSQQMPRSAEDRTRLLEAIAACRQELGKMQHDVPDEVEAFFRAVYANTATLSALTPGVLQWLADNGQLQRYVVRSAAQ